MNGQQTNGFIYCVFFAGYVRSLEDLSNFKHRTWR